LPVGFVVEVVAPLKDELLRDIVVVNVGLVLFAVAFAIDLFVGVLVALKEARIYSGLVVGPV
jgi:hypothetical protein